MLKLFLVLILDNNYTSLTSDFNSSGDANFKPYVCAEAEVRSIPVTSDDEFLIMASDGLLDFVTAQEAAYAVFQQLREDNHGEY